jgi:hypothetical protein
MLCGCVLSPRLTPWEIFDKDMTRQDKTRRGLGIAVVVLEREKEERERERAE